MMDLAMLAIDAEASEKLVVLICLFLAGKHVGDAMWGMQNESFDSHSLMFGCSS